MQSDDASSLLSDPAPLYADVLVPRHIAKSFTYLIPPALRHAIGIGQRVLVPFGRATLEAAVIALGHRHPAGVNPARLKEIHSLADGVEDAKLSSTLFEVSRRISEEYIAPWGQCLRLIFPPMPTRKDVGPRYVATDQGRQVLKDGRCPEPLQPLLARIARRSRGILSSTLLSSRHQQNRKSIKALQANSWIAIAAPRAKETSAPVLKEPIQTDSTDMRLPVGVEHIPLPDTTWAARLAEGVGGKHTGKILVHAPWQYRMSLLAEAVCRTHALKKSAVILCGEAAKAAWLGQLLCRLTKLPIRFLHRDPETPALSMPSDPHNETPSIVVGTRSAIFAPLPSIGLIWVDGEEDPAFKELQEPRYHARDVACMRAEIEGSLLVLASAHPSLESKSDSVAVDCTFQEHPINRPAIELVDLRREPPGALLSQALITAMQDAIATKAGVLLFLNRKGYAGALVCRDCGWVPRCASCAVALTYYRETAKLACRYCGKTLALPESCPTCGAARLNPVGEGTERVELEARRLFPHAKIARLDGDTLRRPAEAHRLWQQVYTGACDVIVGTQALFQREPLPPVGLVGIVQADSGLHVPDFRAAERTYQLLVDAVAVARSASGGGRVVVQTLLPDHHAIASVVSGEPSRFYNEEMAARRLLGYPPAQHLVSLSVSGKHMRLVETAAQQWRTRLEQTIDREATVMILGPVPALGGRPRGHHRRQMLVKGADRPSLCRVIRDSVERMEREYKKGQIKFVVDVDPVDMG